MAPPKKRFCKHGHDTHICGRTSGGFCKTCNNEIQQRYKLRTRDPPTIRVRNREWDSWKKPEPVK